MRLDFLTREQYHAYAYECDSFHSAPSDAPHDTPLEASPKEGEKRSHHHIRDKVHDVVERIGSKLESSQDKMRGSGDGYFHLGSKQHSSDSK